MLTSWMSLENWHILGMPTTSDSRKFQTKASICVFVPIFFVCYSICVTLLPAYLLPVRFSQIFYFFFTCILIYSFIHFGFLFVRKRFTTYVYVCIARAFYLEKCTQMAFVYSFGCCCKCVESICLNKTRNEKLFEEEQKTSPKKKTHDAFRMLTHTTIVKNLCSKCGGV